MADYKIKLKNNAQSNLRIANFSCFTNFRCETDESWLTATGHLTPDKYLDISVEENTGASARTGTISAFFDEGVPPGSTACTLTIEVVQEGAGCPSDYLKNMATTIQEEGATCVPLGRFKNNLTDYTTAFTVTVSDGSTMAICQTDQPWGEDALWNLVQINVPQNPSESARTITIECTLTKGTKTCSESINITQPGSTPPTPGACDNLGLTATTADVGSGVGNVSVGTISGSHTISAGTGTPSWITVKKGIGDPAPVSLTIQQNTSTSARTGTVTFNVDGTDCAGKTVSVSQSGSTQPTMYYNIALKGPGGGHPSTSSRPIYLGWSPAPDVYNQATSVFGETNEPVVGTEFSWDTTSQTIAAVFVKASVMGSNAKFITIGYAKSGQSETILLNRGAIPETEGWVKFDTNYNRSNDGGVFYFYFENA